MRKLIIMGSGGRDVHNFNVAFRTDANTEVGAFTATRSQGIDTRVHPPALAGPRHPGGSQTRPGEGRPGPVGRKGAAEGELVEVSGDLKAGDKVVRRGTDELREGNLLTSP